MTDPIQQLNLGGPHREAARSRRDFLMRAGCGFGGLALMDLMGGPSLRAEGASPGGQLGLDPMTPRQPHHKARALNVIWIFIDGGPSAMDTFDPKPEMNRLAGQPLPPSFKRPVTAMGRTSHTPLLACKRKWARHGQSGTWVSDWLPETARWVDEMAVIRSCKADGLNHVGSVCQMNTGTILAGRPSLGAWSVYGLGSEAKNLPGYVVMLDYPDDPPGGGRNWGTGFMPPAFQGTKFREGANPILHLAPPAGISVQQQRARLDFIRELNERHQARRQAEQDLEARIASYELAYRMQAAAPEAVDLSRESAATQEMYGMNAEPTRRMGRNCLMARRLVERGVRFVQVYSGSGSKWDAHGKIEENHTRYCRESDKPVAALLADLKNRGMLENTLVVWAGEFGRTPMSENGDGRDHNPWGFTIWMAGGGVKGGLTYGSTDELGLYAVENPVHVNDIHATILHLMGLDHMRLTYPHGGRAERATVNGGRVVHDLLA